MIRFAREYESLPILQQAVAKLPTGSKGPQPVAQMPNGNPLPNLQQLVAKIPWGHNILLLEKVKDLPSRLWYMQQTIEQGWSRDMLGLMIKNNAYKRQGCYQFPAAAAGSSVGSGAAGLERPLCL